jgi:hypothetical protein
MNSFEKLAKHPLKHYPMSYPYGNVRVDRKKDTDEQQADYQRPKPSRCDYPPSKRKYLDEKATGYLPCIAMRRQSRQRQLERLLPRPRLMS